MLQLIYLGLGIICILGFLLVHRVVCMAMDCGEYDRLSYLMSWIFCSPIAAFSLYFWWLAFT